MSLKWLRSCASGGRGGRVSYLLRLTHSAANRQPAFIISETPRPPPPPRPRPGPAPAGRPAVFKVGKRPFPMRFYSRGTTVAPRSIASEFTAFFQSASCQSSLSAVQMKSSFMWMSASNVTESQFTRVTSFVLHAICTRTLDAHGKACINR